jgi:hypothetical protein
MKKLMIALICGLILVPAAAWGQKWIYPYTDKDGKTVEGHWQTQEERNKERYSTPGTINPYTGQFNPYTGGLNKPQPLNPNPPAQNPYYPQPVRRY